MSLDARNKYHYDIYCRHRLVLAEKCIGIFKHSSLDVEVCQRLQAAMSIDEQYANATNGKQARMSIQLVSHCLRQSA